MRALWIGLILLMTTGTGWAKDISGTFKTDNKHSFTIDYKDEEHMKMWSGPDNYVLVSGPKTYAVNRVQGKWKAYDMDEMAAITKKYGKGPDPDKIKGGKLHFEYAGREETIATYTGKVYWVTYTDASGKSEKEEMVLSDHPDVRKLHEAWISLATRMAKMFDEDTEEAMEQVSRMADEKGYGGILRAGDDMILESLDKITRKASYYQLPKDVELVHAEDMGNFGGGAPFAGGAGSYQGGAAGQAGNYMKDEAKGFASETAGELKDEGKQELKETTKDEAKKFIKSLW